jgi:hypothetical protein
MSVAAAIGSALPAAWSCEKFFRAARRLFNAPQKDGHPGGLGRPPGDLLQGVSADAAGQCDIKTGSDC